MAKSVAVFLVAGLLAVGCASNQSAPGNVNLAVFGVQVPKGLYDDQLAQYQREHPNVHIHLTSVPFPQYLQSLETLESGGGQVDVLFIQGDSFVQLTQLGLLMDLTNKIGYYNRFAQDLYYKGFYELNGKRYGVPDGVAYIMSTFYNKAIYDKYGLAPPTDFPSMLKSASTLNSKGILPFGVGYKTTNQVGQVMGYIEDQISGNNADKLARDTVAGRVKFTDPVWQGIFQCALQWMQPSLIGTAAQSVDATGQWAAFYAGKSAATSNGNWNFPTMISAQSSSFQPVLSTPPLCPNSPAGTRSRVLVYPGDMWGISSKSKNTQAALDFLDFISSDANATARMKFYNTNLSTNVNASFQTTNSLGTNTQQLLADGFVAADWLVTTPVDEKVADEFYKVRQGKETILQALQNVETYKDSIQSQLPTYTS
jgi:ABC-type glycerol-3-phosphate transport system substrate-binding protein